MSLRFWNRMAAAAGVLCAAGVLWTEAGGGRVARALTLLGAALCLIGILGSGRWHAVHPCRCPVCGHAQKPKGRWAPGLGRSGADPMTCEACGAEMPLSAWRGERDAKTGETESEKE